jgi:tetratricopeptide (TPR) repeat protein
MCFVRLFLVLLACTVSVAAQSTGSPPTAATSNRSVGNIRGKVILQNGSSVSQSVRINLLNLRGTRDMVVTDNQGQFDFRSLTPGDYTIEVEGDRLRYEVSRETVHVFGGGATSVVTITLKEKTSSSSEKPAGNVISAGEIENDVPEKAKKEFERAGKLSKEGKALEAIDHLKKAIAIYPNFLMAHNDLGAQLLDLGRLDEAETELRRAIELDQKAFNPYLNLGIVLIRQQRYAEGVEILKKATSLGSDSPAAKLYLGVALMNVNELEEAERELKAAYNLGGASYAIALFYLGEVYMNKGERALARQAFEAYLHDEPNAENSAQARKWIGMLH